MKVKLIRHTHNPDELIALAGKLCYSKSNIDELEEKLDEYKVNSFIQKLVGMGHESPTEHATFTFAVEGVSRSLLAQLTRHRLASYSVQSQRYVRYRDNFEYVVPKEIEKYDQLKKDYIKKIENDWEAYNDFVDRLMIEYIADYWRDEGVPYEEIIKHPIKKHIDDLIGTGKKHLLLSIEKKAIENARYLLPEATATKIIFTMNTRNLYNFFNLRCCERAQDEIREMADMMLKEVKKVAPILFKNAGAKCVKLGYCPEGKMSCGKFFKKKTKE